MLRTTNPLSGIGSKGSTTEGRTTTAPKKSFARKVITKPKMIMPLLLGLLAVGMLYEMIFVIPAQNSNDPFKERNTYPLLRKSLSKTQGQGWDIHPVSFLQKKTSQECHWHDFVATSGNTAKMCLHDEKDAVSGAIRGKGRFHHCDILPKLWAEATKTPNSVYLEIGANIGSCVMEMLLSTDAKIIAFEPHPYNGWVLQQTIQNLDPSLQRRVVLVPVGLGSESATSKIFASPSNMGNSVVGKVIKDTGGQSNSDFVEHEIHIEPLSAILDANSGMDVPLVKLDAQGFECQILQGIDPPLAKTISKIKLEVAPKWLRQQGCLDLYQGFEKLGFTVRREGSNQILQGEIPKFGMFEAIATKKYSL